jgi:predicted RNA-binding Zn-ribbon protein involved in translation (DUF1610 family)
MDDGDGAFTLELQAFKIAQNATQYKGSALCPQCGIVMNPVEYMYSLLCPQCTDKRRAKRVKGRMS